MEALKDQIKGLMNERSSMEDEISVCSARLEAARVGSKGALVDSEVGRACAGTPLLLKQPHASL